MLIFLRAVDEQDEHRAAEAFHSTAYDRYHDLLQNKLESMRGPPSH